MKNDAPVWRLFSKPLRRTAPGPARRDEGLLTHAAFKARALPVIDRALAAHGLDRVSDYLWAAAGALDVRPVFALDLFKGAAVVPRWGVSLGFVPHSSDERAVWHRTQKSAPPDLFEIPPNRSGELGLAAADDRVGARVEAALAMALPRAETFWALAKAKDLDALLARAEACDGPSHAFSSSQNANRDIVRAFIAAHAGRAAEAWAHLDAVTCPDPAAQAALRARLAAARTRLNDQPA